MTVELVTERGHATYDDRTDRWIDPDVSEPEFRIRFPSFLLQAPLVAPPSPAVAAALCSVGLPTTWVTVLGCRATGLVASRFGIDATIAFETTAHPFGPDPLVVVLLVRSGRLSIEFVPAVHEGGAALIVSIAWWRLIAWLADPGALFGDVFADLGYTGEVALLSLAEGLMHECEARVRGVPVEALLSWSASWPTSWRRLAAQGTPATLFG